MKIAHVALSVKNLDVSKNFYMDLFQLQLVYRGAKADSGKKFLFLEDEDGTRLELFSDSNPKPLRENLRDTKNIGMKHIAFAVDNIEAFLKKHENKKIQILNPIKKGTSVKRYMFIVDPDNIPIELFEV